MEISGVTCRARTASTNSNSEWVQDLYITFHLGYGCCMQLAGHWTRLRFATDLVLPQVSTLSSTYPKQNEKIPGAVGVAIAGA